MSGWKRLVFYLDNLYSKLPANFPIHAILWIDSENVYSFTNAHTYKCVYNSILEDISFSKKVLLKPKDKVCLIILSNFVSALDSSSYGDYHSLRFPWCRRCPWCSRYCRRKWTRRHEFKSWTRLIAFHIALILLGKVWIQLFSLQLWINTRTD